MFQVEMDQWIKESELLLIGIGSGVGGFVTNGKNLDYNTSKNAWEQYCGEKYTGLLQFYNQLYEKIEHKNFFILNTCMDGVIDCSNIPKDRVVSPCGSILRLQCNCVGEQGIWDSAEIFQEDKKFCPVCKREFVANVHGVPDYNESSYLKQWERYHKWLSGTLNKKLLILELGSDFQYAGLMRWPFEKIVMLNQKSHFIRVNAKFPQGTPELKERFMSVEMEPVDFVESILL